MFIKLISAWSGRRYHPDDKLSWTMGDVHILPSASVIKKSMTEKEHYTVNIIHMFLLLFLYGGLFLIHVAVYRNVILSDMATLVRELLLGGLVFAVIHIIFWIGVNAKPSNSRVLVKNLNAINELNQGARYADLDLDPSYIRDKSINKGLRATHINLCCSKALETENYELLGSYMYDIDQMLWIYNQYSKENFYTPCYYHILFFSTYINPNVQNAMKFYNVIKDELEKDMDPNGRRVLAYYQYYIMRNPELADKTIRAAEDALAKYELGWFSKAEIELERKLIRQLRVNMAYGH
jgi:hypothetical protein